MVESGIAKILADFFEYVLKSIYAVPIEISVGSAILVTFITVLDEIFGRLSLWRLLLVTIWGIVLLDFFIPLGQIVREQVWLVVVVVGCVVGIVERIRSRLNDVLEKRNIMECPHCGHEVTPGQLRKIKRSRRWFSLRRNQSHEDQDTPAQSS